LSQPIQPASLPPLALAGSALGMPLEPKRFVATLDPAVSVDVLLNLLGEIFPQLGVQLKTREVAINSFDVPARGFLAEAQYQSSRSVINPESAFDRVVPVNGIINIECAFISRANSTEWCLTFHDNETWLLPRAEDIVTWLLFRLVVDVMKTGQIPGEINWICVYGRWKYEKTYSLRLAEQDWTVIRQNPPHD